MAANWIGKRVFDGAKLRATYFDEGGANTGPCIVRFDHRQTGKSEFEPPQPIGYALKRGYRVLTLQTAVNDWYINAETRDLERVLRDLQPTLGPTRSIGFSMGGFGALRFADVLNTEIITAISPIFSIDPAVVRADRRFRADGKGMDFDLAAIWPRRKADVVGQVYYDPFRPLDRIHARRIKLAFPLMRVFALNGGGHPASGLLSDVNASKKFIALGVHGGLQRAKRVQKFHNAQRIDQARYWQNLSRYMGSRRLELAQNMRAIAQELDDGRQDS